MLIKYWRWISEKVSIDDLPLGLHTITLTVEDDEGENDSDDVVVIVNEEL